MGETSNSERHAVESSSTDRGVRRTFETSVFVPKVEQLEHTFETSSRRETQRTAGIPRKIIEALKDGVTDEVVAAGIDAEAHRKNMLRTVTATAMALGLMGAAAWIGHALGVTFLAAFSIAGSIFAGIALGGFLLYRLYKGRHVAAEALERTIINSRLKSPRI